MFIYVDETFQLGLDCVAALSPRRYIVYGWVMAPRYERTDITIASGDDGACPIEYCSFHTRPDVAPGDPRLAIVNGFTLVFATPQEARPLTFSVAAGDAVIQADLRDPSLETNLFKATFERDWRITFGLLKECVENPDAVPILGYQQRPLGAFADWMAKLPMVRGRVEGFGSLSAVQAVASPAGEVAVSMGFAGPTPRAAELEGVAVAYLRADDDGPAEVRLLPLRDWQAKVMPGAANAYGRLDLRWLERLQSLELVVQAWLGGQERVWLRCQPRPVELPEFLDTACRPPAIAATADNPAGAVSSVASAGLAMLRQVIASREAALVPELSALLPAALASTSVPEADAPPDTPPPPRIALLLGAEDRTLGRLLHVTAAEFESRFDELLILGAAADDAAQVFSRRGRLPVATGAEAVQSLKDVAGKATITAVDALRLAEAIIRDDFDAVFGHPLRPAEVSRLLMLHLVAGTSQQLADSLERLVRMREARPDREGRGSASWPPISRDWSSPYAAQVINEHLARLWFTASRSESSSSEAMEHA